MSGGRLLAALLLLSLAVPASAKVLAVTASVFVQTGDNEEIAPANLGRVANAGFIVGQRAVMAVDTGVSNLAGEALLSAIEETTDKPVELAVLTHASQEFIFGATAFQQRGIAVLAHRETAQLMQQRCQHCLDRLNELLGAGIMRDTRLVKPEYIVDTSTTINLGNRTVALMHYGWASTPGDLAVFDRSSGTLFAGGLVTAQRIPSLRDGQLDGWIKALRALQGLPFHHLVPGFGPVGGKADIDAMLSYLHQLDRAVRQQYRSGASLIETMRLVDLPAFRNWRGYESTHPQNVLYVYRRIEDSEFR